MRFVLALMWAIAVVGLGTWVSCKIQSDRLDVPFLDAVQIIGALVVTGALAAAGFIWAARR